MVDYHQRRTVLRRIAYIALAGALIFSWLLYYSATASTTMLLRLYHDQDSTGTVTDGDIVAAGVEVTVTEQCTGSVCAASPSAYVVVTDSDGYASIALDSGEYSIAAPCMVMSVRAADVSGQVQQDVATCGLHRVWMTNIQTGDNSNE